MGWYFRRSISLGPLRLNVSKRGVGVSAGVRGARIGVDAKGDSYVSAGRAGFYFRQRLGHKIHSGTRAQWVWFVIAFVVVVTMLIRVFGK
jgi:Protein of unknown function (DUF4236)